MPYLPNIPQPTDNISDSQGQILGNFQQLQTSFSVNHVPLTTASNNGKHTFIEMPTLGSDPTLPPGLLSGEGTLFVNTKSSVRELYYTPDVSGNSYRLTATSTLHFPTFSTSTNYPSATSLTQFGGWTFLGGGMLLQYGFEKLPGSSSPTGTLPFPRSFSGAPFSVQLTLNATNSATANENTIFVVGSPSSSSFVWGFTGSTSYNFFYWMAIGRSP